LNFFPQVVEKMLKYHISCQSVLWEPSCSIRREGQRGRCDDASSRLS